MLPLSWKNLNTTLIIACSMKCLNMTLMKVIPKISPFLIDGNPTMKNIPSSTEIIYPLFSTFPLFASLPLWHQWQRDATHKHALFLVSTLPTQSTYIYFIRIKSSPMEYHIGNSKVPFWYLLIVFNGCTWISFGVS